MKKHFIDDIVKLEFADLIDSVDDDEVDELSLIEKGGLFVYHFVQGASFGAFQGLINLATAKSIENERIDNFFSLIDLEQIQKHVADSGEILIANIKNDLIKDFVQPIIEKTEQLIANKANKENQIIELEAKSKTITTSLSSLKTQIEEMKVLESTI